MASKFWHQLGLSLAVGALLWTPAYAGQAKTIGISENYAGTSDKQLVRKAKADDGEAIRQLGFNYFLGRGTKADYRQAASWFLKGIENGDTWCMVGLGLCYSEGYGGKFSYSEAFKLFKKAADLNNPAGAYMVGYCCENGCGVTADMDTAINYYTLAADLGELDACCELVRIYTPGLSSRPDQDKANAMYRRAQDLSFKTDFALLMTDSVRSVVKQMPPEDAKAFLEYMTTVPSGRELCGGELYNMAKAHLLAAEMQLEPDRSKGLDCLRRSAELGFLPASVRLANEAIAQGQLEAGMADLEKMSDEGCRQAMISLSRTYRHLLESGGLDEAATDKYERLLLRLVEAGDREAMYDFGNLLSLDKSSVMGGAVKYWTASAMSGYAPAALTLGTLLYGGSSPNANITVAKDIEMAYQCFHYLLEEDLDLRDIKQNLAPQRVILANMYLYGKGTEANMSAAAAQYRLALVDDPQNAEACYRLGTMILKGQDTQGTVQEAVQMLRVVEASSSPFAKAARELLKRY